MNMSFENMNLRYSDPLNLAHFDDDPARWFADQPRVGDTAWLLAYADDGVIWGELTGCKLVLAQDIFEHFPKLESQTLQHAHLFGSLGEVRVFRQPGGLKALRLEDVADPQADAFTRSYILWGDSVKKTEQGWSWMEDGQLGIHQALPLVRPVGKQGRAFRLEVRYYLHYEAGHGQASVAASRLLALKAAGGQS